MTASPSPAPGVPEPPSFSLHRRCTEIFNTAGFDNPRTFAAEVLASLSDVEREEALATALSAYASRFVAQQRTAGLRPLRLVSRVTEAPASGTGEHGRSRRVPAGVAPASPVVSGRASRIRDLARALDAQIHTGPGEWVRLAEATPAQLRWAAKNSTDIASAHQAAAERYELWAQMVERAQVQTFGELSEAILADALARETPPETGS